MKIAIVAPIEESVPPQKYGGTEWIVYHVANGIGKLGHQVDLYATGDSKLEPTYTLKPTVEKSIRIIPEFFSNLKLRESKKFITYSNLAASLQKETYDIIHNHIGWRFLLFSNFITAPIVTTHHGPLNIDYQNLVYADHKDRPYVSISNNQREDLPELNFVATIYNGIDTLTYPYIDASGAQDHMTFLARMSHEKGGVDAAQVATKTGHKLIAAAKVDKVDEEYFKEFNKYVDDKHVVYEGELNLPEKTKLLQTAKCLLVPIKWEEPFGLMFTEAMACGTPVITYARGSAPEIVTDGQTGFLVNQSDEFKRGDWIVKKTGVDGLCEAVEKLYGLSDTEYEAMRQASRKRVEEHFSVEKMVKGYEQVYQKIVNKS